MTDNKYGMVGWDDVEVVTAKPNQGRKDLFMRLEEGSNLVRVITKPHEYLVHRYKAHPKDPGFGERVYSSQFHGHDPLIEKGMKPKRRWLIGVIDRGTASYKILDIGPSIFQSIQTLVRSDKWGDPCQYDLDIKVNKQGGASGYYTVVPNPKEPLSPADIEIRQQADLEELKKRCTPPTPEEVAKRVAAIDAKSENLKKEGAPSSPVQDDQEDDDIPDFPAVDGSAAAQ